MTSHVPSTLEHRVVGPDGDTVWLELLRQLLQDGVTMSPRGRATYELTPMVVTITRPTMAVVTVADRRLNYAFMVAEAMWILSGRNDVEYIARYNSKMRQFSDDGVSLYGAYGPWVVKQLPYVVAKLQADQSSRQAVITIWQQTPPSTKDVPCTISMQFLIRDFSVRCYVTMRSSDAWLGLPYDMFSFTRIQEAVAAELNLPPGPITMFLGSSHLYLDNVPDAQKIVKDYQGYRGSTFLPLLTRAPLPSLLNAIEDRARRSIELPASPGNVDRALMDWYHVLRWWHWRKDLRYKDPAILPPTLALIRDVEEQLEYAKEGEANEQKEDPPTPKP